MNKTRYNILDGVRGITLLSMICYHAVWDFVYILGRDWGWYENDFGYIWQQSICWTFILLSGFCWSFGKRKWKRGITVFMGGALIMAVTILIMPQNQVIFGVLTLIGSCMLIMIPLEKLFKQCNSAIGLLVSCLLFALCRNINKGYLGFEGWNLLKLPEEWYANLFTTYLGFPYRGFHSTDYFSIFPWFFLFCGGYFLSRLLREKELLKYMELKICFPLEWIGRHSFEIYLLHQPVLYFGLKLLFS